MSAEQASPVKRKEGVWLHSPEIQNVENHAFAGSTKLHVTADRG
jgi:hypothetical protein